ncbi:hypothetical protein BDR04DRAFT_681162 [Suillus decipiens]|nr:hypothetical protein BDR04DRAFT_681162 [Suillus decipiens]
MLRHPSLFFHTCSSLFLVSLLILTTYYHGNSKGVCCARVVCVCGVRCATCVPNFVRMGVLCEGSCACAVCAQL